ncbi:RCC1 domain-containing protein [Allofrancisella frigidaquae]|uniref:Regulator n=1 Tax=Allofrancisella frigidaquae TaxID=1085644 RepID=A0A6M3HY25_9GAMM|nr:regulator [Allofrancisella frigidaquae]QIV95152.1 regulator [Allofrancisella frigidaquae]
MKKTILLVIFLYVFYPVFATDTFSQTFFDNYNPQTENNFATKEDDYRDDSKLKKYGENYDIENAKEYNCEYDVAGDLRCWKYKLKDTSKSKKSNKKVTNISVDIKDLKIKEISRGADFNCALDNGDDLYCWGHNDRGQLGRKTKKENINVPLKIATDVKFKRIYTKAHYACALDKDNHAYCWGDGTFGEVGNGEKGIFTTPQKVKTDLQFSHLVMATTYTCGVRKDTKEIYCWGKGVKGHSNTSNLDSSVPVKI